MMVLCGLLNCYLLSVGKCFFLQYQKEEFQAFKTLLNSNCIASPIFPPEVKDVSHHGRATEEDVIADGGEELHALLKTILQREEDIVTIEQPQKR